METVKLPVGKVAERRREIWTQLRQPDRFAAEDAYAQLVQTISHPAAIFRVRLVPGTTGLQYFLNLILLLRPLIWPSALLLAVLSFVSSWLYILGLPVLVGVFYGLNSLQTRINVELAARLVVLDLHLDESGGLASFNGDAG